MSQRTREIQVGIAVIVALGLVIAGLMFFKNVRLTSGVKKYAVDFSAVEGLRVGDSVQVRGIRSGSVSGFDFLPDKVRVFIEVDDWIDLREDAEVVLVQKGIVGEVVLDVDPGTGPSVLPGYVFTGRNAASIVTLGDKVNKALSEVTALSEELRHFLQQLRVEGEVIGTLATAQRTLLELEGMMAENRDNLRRSLNNLADLTDTLNAKLAEGQLDSTLAAAQLAATRVDSAMVELTAISRSAKVIMGRLEKGEGTAGRVLTDETLYDRADSTLQSLDRLLDQMRRDPKAFFKIEVF